ncbi:MAG TPA: efflux RND transporter periplasmic adaptor subunit [Thermoanaerobaculia bacterium]|jgi:cobalt-zinc-cadmium efflux system membrane fusion protein|nr:efflux RND transporter periplasmic adaptor subunit [Thermoanaerobaculia bacterium]
MRPRRNLLLVAFASAASVLSLTACAAKDDKPAATETRPRNLTLPAPQRAKIRVETIATSRFRRTVETTGTVAFDADQATQVIAPISGPVSRLLVNVGAAVRKAEPLASISSPDFGAAVGAYRKAEVAARNFRRIADLDAQLFQNDALARRELEQAETDAISAEADRDAALMQLHSLGVDETTMEEIRKGRQVRGGEGLIRSPIDGLVVEKLITPGQLIQAGTTPCFTVADLSIVWVMANVFGSDLPYVATGDQADVTPGGTPDVLPAKVDYIAAMVDPNTRAVSVRLVARNPQGILKRDEYVRVALHSRRESEGLLAPTSAILRDDENLPFVFVANADGTFARQRIEVGPQIGDRIEVRSGLKAGQQIVIEGGLFMQFAESQ